ncbi:transcriptional regulator, Fis family [gamma proteobacterium HTCC5015]|nr:transcriptional regulator, Fis family [gamma proteobacterium HTCC5015]
MHITHINLAKGFRGGERQTELLIKALSEFNDIQQTLVSRHNSPIKQHLLNDYGVNFVTSSNQIIGHFRSRKSDVTHAHEARAIHWSWLHSKLFSTPYVLTRRIDCAVKDRWLNHKTYDQASSRVAISRAISKQITNHYAGDVEIIHDAYAGFTHQAEATQKFRNQFSQKFIIGHVAALVDSHKGQRVLLQVAKEIQHSHPEIHFVFLGSGVDHDILKSESQNLHNVSWLGFKSNIADYIAGLDLFAFPSRSEGLGSSILDAMDLEIPVIASAVGGIPDIVKHQENGLLFENGKADQLKQSILNLYKNRTLAKTLASTAKEQLDQYSMESMAKKYLVLYEKAIRENR